MAKLWVLVFCLALLSLAVWPKDGPALRSSMAVKCPLPVLIKQIDEGRNYLQINGFSDEELLIQLEHHPDAKYLMIRKGSNVCGSPSVALLQIAFDGEKPTYLEEDARHFIPLPKNEDAITLNIQNGGAHGGQLTIDEIGLYGKIPPMKQGRKFYFALIAAALGLISILGIFAFRKGKALPSVLYFIALPIAVQSSLMFLLFSPEWGRDFRVDLASGAFAYSQNFLSIATSILQGNGPLLDGMPIWCRMPGYCYLVALFGNPSDAYQTAIHAVILQISLFALSLGFFFYAASRIMPPIAAAFLATVIAFLPFKLFLLWVESVMPTVALLCLGAAFLFCEQYYKNNTVHWKYHLLLHSSFALWFSVRTDVLPAWAIIALVLYAKRRPNWKYFLIPMTLYLIIGVPWALFKLPYIHRFSMSTESIGASSMAGLWEIPHPFVWEATDGSYFAWMEKMNQPPTFKEGSDFAVKEVIRFYFTYPIYTCSLVLHKFLLFAKSLWGEKSFGLLSWLRLYCIGIIVLSFLLKHKRLQTLLLSWPIFLNVPFFFLFYGGPRFWNVPVIFLLTTTLLLLSDREFYKKACAEPCKALYISIAIACIIVFGPAVDGALLRSRARYWAPMLDPAHSTLNVVRKQQHKLSNPCETH